MGFMAQRVLPKTRGELSWGCKMFVRNLSWGWDGNGIEQGVDRGEAGPGEAVDVDELSSDFAAKGP